MCEENTPVLLKILKILFQKITNQPTKKFWETIVGFYKMEVEQLENGRQILETDHAGTEYYLV